MFSGVTSRMGHDPQPEDDQCTFRVSLQMADSHLNEPNATVKMSQGAKVGAEF